MFGWCFGELVTPQGASPDIRNRVSYDVTLNSFANSNGMTAIKKINRLSPVPASAITTVSAFGQWTGLASSLIGAIGGIGSAAITAALAPSVKSATTTATTAQPATVIQPAAPTTNYTPWLIGGGLAFGGLMLAMTMRRRDDSPSRRRR